MKYNDNGEVKNIIIKSGDTLPIGTEVEYDGETIPAGWQEVEVEHKILKKTVTTDGWNTPLKLNDYDGYNFITFYIISDAFKDVVTMPIDVLKTHSTDNPYTITSNNNQYMSVGMYGTDILVYKGHANTIEIVLYQ